jgi:hypothetical protein
MKRWAVIEGEEGRGGKFMATREDRENARNPCNSGRQMRSFKIHAGKSKMSRLEGKLVVVFAINWGTNNGSTY